MAENITNELMYETLKALRGDVGDVKLDIRDMKGRLASIESYIATRLERASASMNWPPVSSAWKNMPTSFR